MLSPVLPTFALALLRVTHSIRGKSEPDGRPSLGSGSARLAECGSASFHFRSLYEGGGVPVSSSTVEELRRDWRRLGVVVVVVVVVAFDVFNKP